MRKWSKYFYIFLFSCLIGVSCSYKTKYGELKFKKEYCKTKQASIKFSALSSFSNHKTSALNKYYNFKLKEYMKKSIQLSNWIENKELPPNVFICKNGYYFLLSVTKNPTGLDTNFYHWIILDNKGEVVAVLLSFSKNINNCYIENGKIHMVIYDYDDEFFFKEESELIPIIEKNFIVERKLVLSEKKKFYVSEILT